MNLSMRISGRKDWFWIVLLSIIVLIPNIFLAFYGSDFNGSSLFKPVIYLVFSCLLFLLPSLVLKTKPFFAVQGIFILFASLEIGHIFLNKMPVTQAFLLSVVDTNWDESFELMTSLKIPILAYFLLCCIYYFIVFKKLDNSYLVYPLKKRLYVAGIFLFILCTGYTGIDSSIKLHKTYPYDLLFRSYQVYASQQQIQKGNEKLKHFRFDAQKIEPINGKEVYVFVIGETGRYNSYSLNGYKRETSPLLSKTENLISYSDFFSEANITSSSLSLILTRATAMDYKRSYVEKSFVDAFKEAGFKTYWIANQSARNNFIRRIAKDTDDEFFNASEFNDDGYLDENLWIPLNKILARNDEKALIVIHTLGSHFRYNFRYPNSYEVFKPSLKGSFDYTLISYKHKQEFINTYDNSILYTDFFLANTIQKIDSLQAVSALVYVSDHGENLFDTDEHIVLHGGSYYTEYDFHIPFFIWTSAEYRRQYPDKAQQLYRNKDKKLNTSHIFYSMLDIADITFPEQIEEQSIASGNLQEDSARYIINTNMEVKRGY